MSVQALVQMLGFASGLLLVRSLSQQEYAYFTIANGMQATIAILADSGISIGLSSIGGKVWQDRHRFGELINTALRLRRYLAVIAAAVVAPILIWLLVHKGAPLPYAGVMTLAVLLALNFQLTSGVLEVVPRLYSQIRRVQRLDAMVAASRLVLLTAAFLIFLDAAVAIFASIVGIIAQYLLLKRWTADTIELQAPVNSEDQRAILGIVKHQVPTAIFFCIQGQMTIWLISIFGKTENVAEIGALSRLGMVFAIINAVMTSIVLPGFARCQEPAVLRRRYFQIVGGFCLLGAGLIAVAALFPDQLLWILGGKYAHLRSELVLVLAMSATSTVVAAMWSLNSTKAWIAYSWLNIPGVLAMQIVLLTVCGYFDGARGAAVWPPVSGTDHSSQCGFVLPGADTLVLRGEHNVRERSIRVNDKMYILGISAFYHDSAACLVRDGEIIAAAQEERFTRKKHDHNFPLQAVRYCLKEAGITVDQLAHVGFYDKPLTKFERLLETYLGFAPTGIQSFIRAMPLWLKEKLWIPDVVRKELGYNGSVLFTEHHESHAASAFYPSPFDEAAILTMDGVGEWATSSYGVGRGNEIELTSELRFPHSLGLLYSAFTYYTGFRVNSGEYKVMGLAPYGEPKYVDVILNELIDLKEDGSLALNLKYFNFCQGLTMTNRRFDELFGGPPRQPESPLTQREMDLARSIQDVTEEVMLRMARHVHKVTGQKNLCLAGGVALNCVGNGKIRRQVPFENIWIQPAAGDAGGAIGAALAVWHSYLGNERQVNGNRHGHSDGMKASLLGPDAALQLVLWPEPRPVRENRALRAGCSSIRQPGGQGRARAGCNAAAR